MSDRLDAGAAAQLCFELADMLGKIEQGADHYQVLGVNRRDKFGDIKKSYRDLAKKFHPDRHSQLAAFDFQVKDQLDAVFAAVQRAYDVLGDDDKRRKYDAELRFSTYATHVSADGSRPLIEGDHPKPSPLKADRQLSHMYASMPLDAAQAEDLYLEISDFLANIQQGMNHYQVLGIPRKAPKSDVRKAYRERLKKFHPDHSPQLESYGFQARDKLETIFVHLQDAHDTLNNNDKRRKYDASLMFPIAQPTNPSVAAQGSTPLPESFGPTVFSEKSAPPHTIQPPQPPPPHPESKPVEPPAPSPPSPSITMVSAPKPYVPTPAGLKLSPDECCDRGVEFFKQGNTERGIRYIQFACDADPKNAWFQIQLARALKTFKGRKRHAADAYKKAVELHPKGPELADLLVEMSDFYATFFIKRRAAEALRQALEINPAHEQAKQKLQKYAAPAKKGWKNPFSLIFGKSPKK